MHRPAGRAAGIDERSARRQAGQGLRHRRRRLGRSGRDDAHGAVVSFSTDTLGLGLAQSYARPGGNITGVALLGGALDAKPLTILRDAIPDRRRATDLVSTSQRTIVEAPLPKAATDLGIERIVFAIAAPGEYPAVFDAMRPAGAEAAPIGATPELRRDVKQIADLALAARLPTVCEWVEMARDGCTIGYGSIRPAPYRRTCAQIALVRRGRPAGNIAIERLALFEFGLDWKTARSLGLAIPAPVLASADEAIESAEPGAAGHPRGVDTPESRQRRRRPDDASSARRPAREESAQRDRAILRANPRDASQARAH
ncbi:MAG: hypothetical protein JNK67_01795 [Alphaproteobacteria bacterium]|nr:hypothetical protein [Alphaproteobacteria bacterium]